MGEGILPPGPFSFLSAMLLRPFLRRHAVTVPWIMMENVNIVDEEDLAERLGAKTSLRSLILNQ